MDDFTETFIEFQAGWLADLARLIVVGGFIAAVGFWAVVWVG